LAYEIVMPRVDMDMTSGRMGRWHAAEGQFVTRGATLFEIETDKAAMEVEAPASGVLKFVAAQQGDVLPVGACIGWIVADGEDFAPSAARANAASIAGGAPAPAPESASAENHGAKDAACAAAALGLRATPAARRAARERGLRLEEVRGSGPNGRIQLRDLDAPQSAVAADPRGAGRGPHQGIVTDARATTGKGPPQQTDVHREWLRRGEGAPIVFIHGLCSDLNAWRPVFRLLPETRPALAIDLPGHGLSSLREEASFEALVEAARGVMIEEGATQAHLVGHSLGGAVVAALSDAPGVKPLSLMLIAPAGLGEETNPAFFDGFLQADTEAGLTPWLNLLVTDPASLGSALAAATLRGRIERPLVAAQRRLAKALLKEGRQTIDIRDGLKAPTIPVKVLFGEEDRITPAHHAEGLSGLVALHRFAKIGHMPHLEARREVARLIEELVRAGASA
jgi:pyruvate dehydrogenase E2 component (dihydrolipoamide acetyltransferase)